MERTTKKAFEIYHKKFSFKNYFRFTKNLVKIHEGFYIDDILFFYTISTVRRITFFLKTGITSINYLITCKWKACLLLVASCY